MDARHLLAAPLVAAAVASPYLSTEGEPKPSQETPWNGRLDEPWSVGGFAPTTEPPLATDSAPAAVAPASPPQAAAGIPPFDASRAQFAGAPVSDFSDVFRFDITPEWIFTRWSRVSTITADHSLKGFRVPLVSGTRVDDLAGVATYYFGRHGLLQRVTFEGNTGDVRRLTAFLTENYGFQAEPNLGAGMYLVRWNAVPMSALRVEYAPVVRADAPHVRYSLKLEINRPDETYRMSDEFRQILGQDQETKRWLPF